MKTLKGEARSSYLSLRTETLLTELGEECQSVLKLLAQLERSGLVETQVDDLVGELSATILHLHEHTNGLDEILDEDMEPLKGNVRNSR